MCSRNFDSQCGTYSHSLICHHGCCVWLWALILGLQLAFDHRVFVQGTVRCQTDGICSQLQLSTLDVRVLARTPQRSVSVDVERFNDGTQVTCY
jgi:hypothetical protein